MSRFSRGKIAAAVLCLVAVGFLVAYFVGGSGYVVTPGGDLNLEESPVAIEQSLAGSPRTGADDTTIRLDDVQMDYADSEHPASTPTGTDSEEIPDNWVALEDEGGEAPDSQQSAAGEQEHQMAQAPGSAHTGSSEAVAQKPASKKGDADADLSSEEIRKRMLELDVNYAALLAKPELLGFSPDATLFRNAYWQIKSSFVENVSDEALFRGVVAEVGKLLKAAKIDGSQLNHLDKTRNVLTQLTDLYGHKVDKRLLNYAANMGMLRALNDPFSVLMTPEEYGQLQEQVQSKEFGGIGVYIESDREAGNQLTIFEPIEGTPAYKAGLEAGDQILAINGKSTKGLALDVATTLIRGAVGSKVKLKVRRRGVAKPFEVSVVRGQIHVVSATSKVLPNHIGYVRLRQFGQYSGQEVATEIGKLNQAGVRGIIFDLRNNGGGYIDAATAVVSQFVEPNSPVVFTKGRTEEYRAYRSGQGPSVHVPVVLLINKFSASASEITAGALRDLLGAKLVGSRSFGKGSVQQLFPFEDSSALKLTIARFYSPKKHPIDHVGLEPDYKVDLEPRFVGKGDKDLQLKKAVQVISAQISGR